MNTLILVAALMGSPCDGCCQAALPGQPVRRVVAAVERIVEAKPLCKAVGRLLERKPVRRLLFRGRCRR